MKKSTSSFQKNLIINAVITLIGAILISLPQLIYWVIPSFISNTKNSKQSEITDVIIKDSASVQVPSGFSQPQKGLAWKNCSNMETWFQVPEKWIVTEVEELDGSKVCVISKTAFDKNSGIKSGIVIFASNKSGKIKNLKASFDGVVNQMSDNKIHTFEKKGGNATYEQYAVTTATYIQADRRREETIHQLLREDNGAWYSVNFVIDGSDELELSDIKNIILSTYVLSDNF